MEPVPFRKDWRASTGIARGVLGTELGARLPTIEEYAKAFGCSRGVVQNALAALEKGGAVRLDKRRKQGTFLAGKDEERLFACAGLPFLTGSMPAPLNMHLAGLATGICQAMGQCPVPFTFAFVQGAKNRADALCRQIYDFAVLTRTAAEEHIERQPELEVAFPLAGCEYSTPYFLYIGKPGLDDIADGMTIAVDPASTDQQRLTRMLCQGRDVRVLERPFLASGQAFLSGEADCVVMRGELVLEQPNLYDATAALLGRRIALSSISVIPIPAERMVGTQQAVVLVNRRNYGIAGILKKYLAGDLAGYIQKRVIKREMAPQFY